MKEIKFIIIGMLFVLLLSNISFAETTCSRNNCDLVITIKIAFVGADDSYISKAKNEIESVWNSPTGNRIATGCNCKVGFKVETLSLNQSECTSAPADYHCITVTTFDNAIGIYANMSGVATGNGSNSLQGWWSDQMSRPVPGSAAGESYKDFAHEAGHMMGLKDGDGGIMSRTSGPNSDPTQAEIDMLTENICGPKPCPDTCCCGNGKVDKDKGEECDPTIFPSGCTGGSECCPYCCSCFARVCDPANNQYLAQADCQNKCGLDSNCNKNYRTGCWDCVKKDVNTSDTCLNPDNVRGNTKCEHPLYKLTDDQISKAILPLVGVLFTSERININISGMGEAHAVIQGGKIVDHGLGTIEDPTVLFTTDAKSVGDAIAGKLDPKSALKNGQLKIEGVGFYNSFRIWFFLFFFDTLEPKGPAYTPTPEEKMPDEYLKAMHVGIPAPNDTSGPGLGSLPDLPYKK